MKKIDNPVADAIAQQAAEWFILNRDGELSAEEAISFTAWLRASPMHVEEYLRVAVTARNLMEAVRTSPDDRAALIVAARADEGSPVSVLGSGRLSSAVSLGLRWRLRPLVAAALAASLAVALFATAWFTRDGQRFGLPMELSTNHGVHRFATLPDGTGVHLNSDSSVTIRYSSHERVVQVNQGQALFRVAHEQARRFRVVAGDAGVIAVGTEFDVFMRSTATVVTVVEGKVAVFTGAAPAPDQRATLPARARAVSAGEQVQIHSNAELAVRSLPNVQQAVAWINNEIAFEQQPLGEVTEEFNRYGNVPIVIQDSDLRSLPISGLFNAYDTESFMQFLSRLDGVRVERSAEQIVVISQAEE